MDKDEAPRMVDFNGTIRWGEPSTANGNDERVLDSPTTSAEDNKWARELLRRLRAHKSPA